MRVMYTVGQPIRIKDNAFPGSPDERDVWARGKLARVEAIPEDLQLLDEGSEHCYDVSLVDPFSGDDLNIYLVLDTEIEPAQGKDGE